MPTTPITIAGGEAGENIGGTLAGGTTTGGAIASGLRARARPMAAQIVRIDDFFIDISKGEEHNWTADVTDYPVESGSVISDNIRNHPLEVSLECLVSNTPLANIAPLRTGPMPPADLAYDAMLKLRDGRKTFMISTSLSTYYGMALKELSIPRASGRGDEIQFTAKFRQIVIVQNKRSKRVAIPQAARRVNAVTSLLGGLRNGYDYLFGTGKYDAFQSSFADPTGETWFKDKVERDKFFDSVGKSTQNMGQRVPRDSVGLPYAPGTPLGIPEQPQTSNDALIDRIRPRGSDS